MNGESLVASVRGSLQGLPLIPRRELELLSSIGEGGFSEVWEGRWFGSSVAIKRFKLPEREHGADSNEVLDSKFSAVAAAFCREVNLHTSLAFPSIVPVLGVCVPHPLTMTQSLPDSGEKPLPPLPLVDLMLVMEQAPLGSLFGLLHVHNHRTAPVPMSLPLRLSLSADCASAVAFMHARKVVHRDLKSMNVLVFPGWRVKLCDLGLSMPLTDCARLSKSSDGGGEEANKMAEVGRGTYAWLAPEAMTERRYSFASDVFSLTCLAYELCARRVPFDGLSDEAIEEAVAHRGERPSLVFQDDATLTSTSSSTHPDAPDEQVTNRLLCQLPTAVRELITQGWGQNPERRPSALELEGSLRAIVDDRFGGDPRTDDLLAALNIQLMMDEPTTSNSSIDNINNTLNFVSTSPLSAKISSKIAGGGNNSIVGSSPPPLSPSSPSTPPRGTSAAAPAPSSGSSSSSSSSAAAAAVAVLSSRPQQQQQEASDGDDGISRARDADEVTQLNEDGTREPPSRGRGGRGGTDGPRNTSGESSRPRKQHNRSCGGRAAAGAGGGGAWDDGLDMDALRIAFLEMAESGVILDKRKELSLHLSRSQGKPFVHNSETGESTFLDENTQQQQQAEDGGSMALTAEIIEEANAIMHKLIRHHARSKHATPTAAVVSSALAPSSSPRGVKKAPPPGRGGASASHRSSSPRSNAGVSSTSTSPPPHSLPVASAANGRAQESAETQFAGGATGGFVPITGEVGHSPAPKPSSSSRSGGGASGNGGITGGPKLRPGTKAHNKAGRGSGNGGGGPSVRRSGGPRAV